jgi:hypothetical protein
MRNGSCIDIRADINNIKENEYLTQLRDWRLPIIEHDANSSIKIWRNQRSKKEWVCLWLVQENHLLILADRGEYILPWTAYLVKQPHQQRKLQKEYEEYQLKNGVKS